MYLYIYVSMYLCFYVSMYLCMHAFVYLLMYVSMYLCIYICIYVSMYVSIYLWMYCCWHIAIHLSLNLLLTWGKKDQSFTQWLKGFPLPTVTSVCLLFLWDLKQTASKWKLHLSNSPGAFWSLVFLSPAPFSLVYAQLKISDRLFFFLVSVHLLERLPT